MPSSSGNCWFITLSPPDFSDIVLAEVESRSTGYLEYHVVMENGSDGDHPHIHAVLKGNCVEKQENVRNRWKSVFSASFRAGGDFRIALKVVPVTDRNRLIGQYLVKEATATVLFSNISAAEIESLKQVYKVAPKAPAASKTVKILSAPALIKKYAASHDLSLDGRYAILQVIKAMAMEGYNFVGVLGRLKHINWQIKLESGIIPEFMENEV